ncbi:MAG: (2Fe-2S)-binding protein [Planctomycetia bacterium]|nr:(2Fe-2S)-binding protein [Planctomycetia bacterium]
MNDDDEVCLCFHVSRRKLANYLRVERISRASQLSECGGAGTGCGWCRSYLERLFAASRQGLPQDAEPTAQEYASQRARYIHAGGGTPPAGSEPRE